MGEYANHEIMFARRHVEKGVLPVPQFCDRCTVDFQLDWFSNLEYRALAQKHNAGFALANPGHSRRQRRDRLLRCGATSQGKDRQEGTHHGARVSLDHDLPFVILKTLACSLEDLCATDHSHTHK